MSNNDLQQVRRLVDDVYRSESRMVLATLIRLLGDFDAAEEAVHDAFAVAVERWSRDGVPGNPRAWLVSTGRFKAIDAMRRRARFDASLPELTRQLDSTTITDSDTEKWDNETVEDDRLRLIFTCCHPSLAPEAQVAMTFARARWSGVIAAIMDSEMGNRMPAPMPPTACAKIIISVVCASAASTEPAILTPAPK